MRVGVIGGGAAGLAAAWALSRHYDTVLFEGAPRLGGHAHTVDAYVGGRQIAVDTGFIVYNERNYPQLTQLLDTLGVATYASDMSFAVSLDDGRIEYAGSAAGFFAQPANLWRRDHWRILQDLRRFSAAAQAPLDDDMSVGELLARGGYSRAFAAEHLLPMAAAIWSSTLDGILAFPARTFVTFLANHGLLAARGRPQWRTVVGGSRAYVARLVADGRFRARTDSAVVSIARAPDGVRVGTADGDSGRFDQVVLATHADQALAILGNTATVGERRALRAFRYQKNRAVLHTDTALLPRRRRVWASWNYVADGGTATAQRVCVSYWMNRLQNLATGEPVVVTLNPTRAPARERILGTYAYDHPQFDRAAIAAQRRLPMVQGADRVWFAGSYCGYGFHEDAIQAGFSVAAALGAPVPWAASVAPRSPAAFAPAKVTARTRLAVGV